MLMSKYEAAFFCFLNWLMFTFLLIILHIVSLTLCLQSFGLQMGHLIKSVEPLGDPDWQTRASYRGEGPRRWDTVSTEVMLWALTWFCKLLVHPFGFSGAPCNQSINQSICLSIYLSVYLFVHLSVCISIDSQLWNPFLSTVSFYLLDCNSCPPSIELWLVFFGASLFLSQYFCYLDGWQDVL